MCVCAGWVSFLREVLEAWYGSPIYDGLIEGNMIAKHNEAHGIPQTDEWYTAASCAVLRHSQH